MYNKSVKKWDKVVNMIFLGTYNHNLDSKNRLSMPAKFAQALGSDVVVSKGFDCCLEVRDVNSFNDYASKLSALAQNKKDTRIVTRQLLANAADIKLDNAKRILVPANLLAEAKISKSVTIIGVGNKIEIWDANTYNKYKTQTDKVFEAVADKLNEDDE